MLLLPTTVAGIMLLVWGVFKRSGPAVSIYMWVWPFACLFFIWRGVALLIYFDHEDFNVMGITEEDHLPFMIGFISIRICKSNCYKICLLYTSPSPRD